MQERHGDEAGVPESNIVMTLFAWFGTTSIQVCSIHIDVLVKSCCQWAGHSDACSLSASVFLIPKSASLLEYDPAEGKTSLAI